MPHRSTARSSVRAVLVLAVALLTTVGIAGTASAHTSLIGSDPTDGAVLETIPTAVTLTFDDALTNFEPVVTITGPDGNQYQSGPATIDGAQVTSAVAPLPAAGSYTIAYRVVSADGHPVEGQVRFDVAPVAVAAPVNESPASTMAATSAGPSTAASAGTAASSTVTEPIVTSSASAAPATASSSWSLWDWSMIIIFLLIASIASLVIRRWVAARSRARMNDDQR